MENNNSVIGKCPDCGGDNWREKKDWYICVNCGYIKYKQRQPIQKQKKRKTKKNHYKKEAGGTRVKKDIISKKQLNDEIIKKNAEKTIKSLEEMETPRFVRRIVKNINLYPVFYLFKEQKLPKKGRKTKDFGFPSEMVRVLEKKKIKNLYAFQEQSIELVLTGHNVVITAPTGSGKTEAFVLPILVKALENPDRKPIAIIIYPTKALARDQFMKIQDFTDPLNLSVMVFDGDTENQERKKIFSDPPNILITNPDMLHYHLMRNHSLQWLIKKVAIIVFDEVHQAVGAFGTSIYYIIKRIRRFNPDFQIIAASATVGNPLEFCETLFDTKFIEVNAGNTRLSPIHIIMTYPRGVSHYTVISILARISSQERSKTLIFSNTHKSAETIFQVIKKLEIPVEIHRGGLTKRRRLAVENKFKKGDLPLLIATPTLELGIDIGEVDSVISELIDITRFTQRIGRGGRKGQESLGVIVLRSDDPISSYYAHHPGEYFEDYANAYVEPLNELVAEKQLLAAASDSPLYLDEFPQLKYLINKLLREEKLRGKLPGPLMITSKGFQELKEFNLRGIGETVKIMHENRIIGQRALPMALRELHPGAIYLLGGESFEVQSLKLEGFVKKAFVKKIPFEGKRTDPLREMSPQILKIHEKKIVEGIEVAYCDFLMTEFLWGYVVKDVYSGKVLETKTLPTTYEYSFQTKGFIFRAPEPTKWLKKHDDEPLIETLGGTYHAIEHVLIEGGNSLTGGGAHEIGGVSLGTTGLIVIYDGAPGGSGLTKLLYNRFKEAILRARKIMEECSCKSRHGCPKCTFSYQCGNNNRPLERVGAIESIKLLGKTQTEISEIPSGKYYI